MLESVLTYLIQDFKFVQEELWQWLQNRSWIFKFENLFDQLL